MSDENLVGWCCSWSITFGWTDGYPPHEKVSRIFWMGPLGLIFGPEWINIQ